MKSIKNHLLTAGLLLGLSGTAPAVAQFMPTVYDRTYGKNVAFEIESADFMNGDLIRAGVSDGRSAISWTDRLGESRVFKRFASGDFERITCLAPFSDTRVLIAGYRVVGEKERRRGAGHVLVMTNQGVVEREFYIGDPGTRITNGLLLESGHIILSGSTLEGERRVGFVCKISPRNKVIYFYTAATGEECTQFNAMGNHSENLHAAFTSCNGKGSSVVSLDADGKPYFLTTLSDETYCVERMVSTPDGDIYLVGQGDKVGGTVVKIRPEGDVVYNKPIVPPTPQTRLNHLQVLPSGELLIGGHDTKNAYYALLRSDGTELTSNVEKGMVTAVARSLTGDHCVVSVYDRNVLRGKVIKLSLQGRKLYEKNTAADYGVMRINGNSDLLMGNASTGRLSMLSSTGELLFDRFAVENTPTRFNRVCLPATGEAFFVDTDGRVIKLAHGIHVSDIYVNKPIDGYAMATFTVTLSGYSFFEDGAPRPVTVDYKTVPVSAREDRNFTPVSGTLSFVPRADKTDRYLNRYDVEVPIMANDLLEGDRTFDLVLSHVTDSYLIRGKSLATIVDQPAIVRMISSTPGIEGESDVVYELGIFKTNGVGLTNATKAAIVIDGIYGNGTADRQDYDMGRQPRLQIAPDKHSGTFSVRTLEDMRYENVKTVVVDFNKIYAMSDTNVSFGGDLLCCEGLIYDQPAMVVIESLGNFNKLNNVVSGFFKVSLLRAKDGALQTNCSGGDIMLQVAPDDASTAVLGKDYVFTNAHDLRIWGDDRSSAVNLNGMVLYTPDNAVKTVNVKLNSATAPQGAAPISVHSSRDKAGFNINSK